MMFTNYFQSLEKLEQCVKLGNVIQVKLQLVQWQEFKENTCSCAGNKCSFLLKGDDLLWWWSRKRLWPSLMEIQQ